MNNSRNNASKLAYGALIAALYVVLTLPFASFAFGPIQFRLAEALCILPFFTPAAIPGLTVGCLLANFLGGASIWDVIFGTFATFIGAWFSYKLRANKWLVCIPPIVANALIIPFVLKYAYGVEDLVPFMMLTVGLSEVISVGVLGNMLMAALIPAKDKIFAQAS
ncbi:MAG: QueT transporter family protein [Firmicutes bacterium]|nr:QueT transporter family protein [Bacillota bacterium]